MLRTVIPCVVYFMMIFGFEKFEEVELLVQCMTVGAKYCGDALPVAEIISATLVSVANTSILLLVMILACHT